MYAVTEVTGLSPTACPPLYETVDPDALDDIFENRNEGSLTFRYAGCLVSVEANGQIVLKEVR